MDELKVTMQARAYMDALAQGIDPISGKKLPEDAALNQEPLARCFAYVSEQLQEKIEDEVFQRSCGTWRERLLASGMLEHVPYSKEPLLLREFLGALGFSGDPAAGKKIPQAVVLEWLVREGLLKAGRWPTAWGKAAGLSKRYGQNESGHAVRQVVCDEAAQHLIVNNLDKIIACYELSFDMILNAWTPELRSRMTYSAKPVLIKAVEGTINGLLEPACGQKISWKMVSDWLLHEGFLVLGKKGRRWPTKEGWKLGISSVQCVEWTNKTEVTNWYIMYDENAQRFIADNLDKIITYYQSTMIVL